MPGPTPCEQQDTSASTRVPAAGLEFDDRVEHISLLPRTQHLYSFGYISSTDSRSGPHGASEGEDDGEEELADYEILNDVFADKHIAFEWLDSVR